MYFHMSEGVGVIPSKYHHVALLWDVGVIEWYHRKAMILQKGTVIFCVNRVAGCVDTCSFQCHTAVVCACTLISIVCGLVDPFSHFIFVYVLGHMGVGWHRFR